MHKHVLKCVRKSVTAPFSLFMKTMVHVYPLKTVKTFQPTPVPIATPEKAHVKVITLYLNKLYTKFN